jgi:putative membrane protein
MLPVLMSALHVLSLGVALGAVFARGRALRMLVAGDAQALGRVFFADNFWGVSALLLIATGLSRLLAETDKALDFYLYNGFFWIKMGLFALVFALEIWPMTAFIRWRVALRKGSPIDTGCAALFVRINDVQTVIVVAIPFAAAAMARGLWLLA